MDSLFSADNYASLSPDSSSLGVFWQIGKTLAPERAIYLQTTDHMKHRIGTGFDSEKAILARHDGRLWNDEEGDHGSIFPGLVGCPTVCRAPALTKHGALETT